MAKRIALRSAGSVRVTRSVASECPSSHLALHGQLRYADLPSCKLCRVYVIIMLVMAISLPS